MRAKEVLLTALEKFSGTVVFVSHDRYFIDKLATRVFEVEDGAVHIYPGNYEDYLWRKQGGQHVAPTLQDVPGMELVGEATPVVAPAAKRGQATQPTSQPSNGDGGANRSAVAEAPKKRLNPLKRKQMEDRVHELEEEISRTESAITQLETSLQNFVNAEENQRQAQELDQHKVAHGALIKEWEELSEDLQKAR
jgi:ATP-binding cassette subfamily F protein 3